MKNYLLLVTFLLIVSSNVAGAEVFAIDLVMTNDGEVNIKEIKQIEGEVSSYYGEKGEYKFSVLDENDDELWSQNRSINFVAYTNPPEPINNRSIYIRFPYSESAENFVIEKSGKNLIMEDIPARICTFDGSCTEYCKDKGIDPDCSCGDNVCQSYENAEVCPQDCADQVDVDSPDTAFQGYWKYILIALALISAGLILLLKQYVQKERDSEEKEEGVETMNNRKYDDLDLDRYNRDSEG